MATLNKAINKSLFDSILPAFGNPRLQVPVWDNSQKMFICNEYMSASGNRYYCGVRFCDNIMVVEKVGIYHSWTYIDSIELYAFNGKRPELIQKKDYHKEFRDESMIRTDTENMIADYLAGVVKAQNIAMNADMISSHAKELTDKCYKSFLDADFNSRLTQILPALEYKQA